MAEMVKDIESLLSEIEGKLDNLEDILTSGVLKSYESEIREIISLMLKVDLDEVGKRGFGDRFQKCKDRLYQLKNNQIFLYNIKIRQLQKKSSGFKSRSLNYDEGTRKEIDEIGELLKSLNKIDFSKANPEWKSNDYFNMFDYTSMVKLYKMLTSLETKLNVKENAGIDIDSMLDEIENELKKLESIDNLMPQQVASSVAKCLTLSGCLASSSIVHEKLRGKITDDEFSRLSHRIVSLQSVLDVTLDKLLEKRRDSVYKKMFDRIELLEMEYSELIKLYFDDEGKCNSSMVSLYKRSLEKLNKKYEAINVEINDSFERKIINGQQKGNLIDRRKYIVDIQREFHEKLDSEPGLIDSDDMFLGIDNGLKKLETDIQNMGSRPIKDRKEINNVGKSIDVLEKKLSAMQIVITSLKGINDDKYNELKIKYDGYKKKFDELNQKYNGKCPLHVKAIRKVGQAYQQHPKLGLISAGLAAMSLGTSNFTIIPAIMYGNQVLGNAVPAVNGLMSFINKVLGGMIGATYKGSSWILATGVTLTSAVATTSILKSLAIVSAVLTAPLYVPKVVNILKGVNVKAKENNLRRKLNKKYINILDEFNSEDNYMTFDEFCKSKKFSDDEKQEFYEYIKNGTNNEKNWFGRKKKR